ncbi:probable RNA 3'-terminal phosphate cyclase-like protein [Condylostylus longicornis]|uniref:probable RNA 3'-terminal phosphate cyclase-like protein n=1 Tax=Condylostylus longicornis TaxID=2530218 RepID=UPI00244E28AD|nr:probable RNA 3'-terminal phosphate cyclase-like protein [Condylostylus longicornis]
MPPITTENNLLVYQGCNFLKQRLILSVLSGKPIKIIDIRDNSIDPGLKEYEISLIRMIDKITNGTKIELDSTGTSLYFSPGLLHGGLLTHDCCVERNIGYYLEALIALGPFCKEPINAKLRGVTNSSESPSVDYVKQSAIPLLKKFLIVDDGLEMHIIKRGLKPSGGGEISFKCPVRKNIRAIQFVKSGMVKRIRGIVFGCKVSPALGNRAVESAKGVMLNFLPDVYINTDQNRGKTSGNSPGYGISLVAETTDGVFYGAEGVYDVTEKGENLITPEDLGKDVAFKLIDEIYRGGCVDSSFQWLASLYIALGEKNISKFLTGPLSQYTINFLQHLRDFFAITFKLSNIEEEEEEEEAEGGNNSKDRDRECLQVLMTCVGVGYKNISKRII